MSHSISTKPGASIFPGNSEFCAKRVPNELIQSIIFTRCRGNSLEADFLPP